MSQSRGAALTRRKVGLLITGIVPAAAIPTPGPAASPLSDVEVSYQIRRHGIDVSRATLALRPAQDAATIRLEVLSTGLVGLITGYHGWWQSAASLRDPERPLPLQFRSYYATRKYSRRVEMHYGPDGRITDLAAWKREVPQRSRVPRALWLSTIDPLTWLLQLRAWLERSSPNAGGLVRTFRIFDGRRRFDLRTTVLGAGLANLAGRQRPVVRLRLEMTALAGFREDDAVVQWLNGGDDRWLELLLAGDHKLPLRLRTVTGSLSFDMTATGERRLARP